MTGAIDLSSVADVLQPGDKFDVVLLDDDGVTVTEGRVVAEHSPEGLSSREQLAAALDANMDAFALRAEKMVASGAIFRTPEGAIRSWKNDHRSVAEQKRVAKARAKAKQQKRARKAQRGRR